MFTTARRIFLCGLMAVLLAGPARAQAKTDQPDRQVDAEAVGYLCDYLKLDTSNPPGNEKIGADFFARVLKDNGIAAQVFETAPGRACVYARLKGSGRKRPVMLLNHIDVVPAQAQDWEQGPFSGKIVVGEIWGRGAIDMKGMGIAELACLLQLKRSGRALDRDVIFLATPDEESGGTHGAKWFVANHPELVKDVEYVLNEGYFIETSADGKIKAWGVDIAEKSVLWLRLTAHGEAGHASMPLVDSAPNKLVQALHKVVNEPPAAAILPAVQEYFKELSRSEAEPLRTYYGDIAAAAADSSAYAVLLKDRLRSSMLRNTVSLTVLRAGYKTNVIPAQAVAELDCRLLPDVDRDSFIAEIKRVIANPQIDVEVVDWVHAQASAYDTELFRAIKEVAKQEQPQMPVVPVVVPWFTDSHYFRELGAVAYGFMPFRIDAAHLATMHGKNERLQVDNFLDGVRILHKIVSRICMH